MADKRGSVDAKTIGVVAGEVGSVTQNFAASKRVIPKKLTTSIPIFALEGVIGRDDVLDKVHEQLNDGHSMLLVNGIGGVGKTCLAQAYVTKYWGQYQHIAWLSQSTSDILNDIVSTPGLLENLDISADGNDSEGLFVSIMNKMGKLESEPNLLVIDNAEEQLSAWHSFLPDPSQWHILVTSREKIDGFAVEQLDFLSAESALDLFKHHYRHGQLSDLDIEPLLKKVDYHTLTIEILAKVAHNQRLSIEPLNQAIKSNVKANIETGHSGSGLNISRIRSYLTAIFAIDRLSDVQCWLMKQLICLPSEFHHYNTLNDLIDVSSAGYGDNLSELLESLSQKGWLISNEETESYKTHQVISDALCTPLKLQFDDVKSLVDVVSDKLYIDQSKDNPVDKFIWVLFGQCLLAQLNDEALPEVAVLQNNLALVLQALGDYEGAKELLEKATILAEQNFGEHHPTTVVGYSNLALVLQALGDYEGAKVLLEKATISDEQNFGEQHPTTAVRYSNLATVLQALGDYEGAKVLLEKATISAEQNFGEHHPSTAVSYSNLALVLQDLGDYEGAKVLLEKATISDEQNFGEHHPATAVSYSNLATVLQALGDYEGAKVLLEKATISDEQNFGEHHPTTAVSYSNLATVLQALGDYEGAKVLLEKATISAEQNLGEHHPTTAVRYSNLALVLQALGDYEGVKALLEKATISDEQNFGEHHPTTAIRYLNLAVVLVNLAAYDRAMGLAERAFSIFSKTLPKGHPHIEIARQHLDNITALSKQTE